MEKQKNLFMVKKFKTCKKIRTLVIQQKKFFIILNLYQVLLPPKEELYKNFLDKLTKKWKNLGRHGGSRRYIIYNARWLCVS